MRCSSLTDNERSSTASQPPAPQPVSPAPADCPGPATVAGRILIVDDDPGIRNLMARALRGAGYRISCAGDGEAGWDALCAEGFDLLITDHEMPRLTGLDLLRRVRAGSLHVPVILTSGRMPWNEKDLLQLLPPGKALEKPFMLGKLLASIRSFLTPAELTAQMSNGQLLRESEAGPGMSRFQPKAAGMSSRESSGDALGGFPQFCAGHPGGTWPSRD